MQRQTNGMTPDQIPQGAHVYDSNNDKVGTVLQMEPNGQYFVAEKGWLFPQDVYIPLSAINNVTNDGVYLRYTKAELQQQDWTTPPTASSTTTNTTTRTGATGKAADATRTTATGLGAAAASTTANAVQGATTDQRDIRVPLREEELVVDKQRQQEGTVHLHKDVVAEQQNVTVPVTHEEVYIDRVTADPNTPVGADAFTDRDIDVPVMGEEVTAEKRAKVADEVRVRKDAVTDQQQVSDTVRKERLHVQSDGTDVHLAQDLQDDTTDTQQH